MKDKKIILAASIVFAIVSVAHLLRIIYGLSLLLGIWQAPTWLSAVAVILAGYLSISLWKIANKK